MTRFARHERAKHARFQINLFDLKSVLNSTVNTEGACRSRRPPRFDTVFSSAAANSAGICGAGQGAHSYLRACCRMGLVLCPDQRFQRFKQRVRLDGLMWDISRVSLMMLSRCCADAPISSITERVASFSSKLAADISSSPDTWYCPERPLCFYLPSARAFSNIGPKYLAKMLWDCQVNTEYIIRALEYTVPSVYQGNLLKL